MFKEYFLNLCNINSSITMERLRSGKEYTKFNWATIRLYHQLYGTGK